MIATTSCPYIVLKKEKKNSRRSKRKSLKNFRRSRRDMRRNASRISMKKLSNM